MSISISGKHIDIGESLSNHIKASVDNVAKKHFGELIDANVTVTKESHNFFTEVALHVSKNFIVRARAEDSDPYRSLDLSCEKLEKRVSKYKSRLRDRKRHVDDEIPALKYVVSATEEDKGEDTPLVIAEMASAVPTLTVGEAVMRMDLSDYPVLMFKNAKHGNLNVVYKRPDGHIGWIDPTIKG